MKLGLVVLILILGMSSYLIYYYIYPELVFKYTWKEITGQDLNLNCWGYDFISNQFDSINKDPNANQTIYITRELKTSEKVSFLRELMNQKYNNFTYSETPSVDIMGLTTLSASTNLVESIYAILKDIVPEERPKACKFVKPAEEEVSKVLLIGVTMTQSGILASIYSSITRNNSEYCINQTDYKICIDNFLKKLGKVAEEKKISLADYKDIRVPKCPNTQVYFDVKDLEKKTREQLGDAKEPFSVIWKSILIGLYDACSEQLVESVNDRACPIIPKNKVEAVGEVISDMSRLAFCSSNYVKNQTDLLSTELIIHE